MPVTFPSHQGVVLPLKRWRPTWFDGVALGLGAAAPDIAYLLDGSGLPVWPFSHEWLGLLGWCLSVTLVLGRLLRGAAPAVAAHLPRGGPLALSDYGALGRVRHPWWVTASSAVVGGASHLALDLVDVARPVAALAGHVAGAAALLGGMVHIGRRRLIARWRGAAPVVRRRPVLFWGTAGTVGVVGVSLVPLLPAAFLWHTTGVRLIAVAVVALVAGGFVAGSADLG